MPENDRQRIYHLRSDEITSGGTPKLPTSEIIDVGELAINYAKDYETMAIKNSSGDIVTFSSDVIIDSHISSAVTNINLGDLADVEISSVTNNQIVKYDSEQSGWVNTDISTLVRLAKDTTYDSIFGDLTNNALVPNMLYRITDYVTTTTQDETRSAGHPFDLIVLATSVNTLDCLARAVLNENDTYFSASGNVCDLSKWQIWYDINNDTTKYAWADSTNGKGVIYRMIDEWGNDCPYDFKNILFTVSGQTANAYTFNVYINSTCSDHSLNGQYCYDNIMKPYFSNSIQQRLNFNVFYNTSSAEKCKGNTFRDNCHSNTFGSYCHSNTFGDTCFSNTFRNYCHSNTFGINFYSNIFGIYCYRNTFGDDCTNNTFGNNCTNNTFGNYFYDNRFGYECKYNTFGNECYSNRFGSDCVSNTFVNYCFSNTFGNNCYDNTFGNSCYCNTFGNNCDSNTFGNTCHHNTFGNSNNQYGTYVRYVVIESGNQYIRLYNSGTADSSHYLQNIYIAQGFNNTTTYKNISTISRNLSYRTTVAQLSDGTTRIYKEDDSVVGPTSSLEGNIAVFADSSGKKIIDSGLSAEDLTTPLSPLSETDYKYIFGIPSPDSDYQIYALYFDDYPNDKLQDILQDNDVSSLEEHIQNISSNRSYAVHAGTNFATPTTDTMEYDGETYRVYDIVNGGSNGNLNSGGMYALLSDEFTIGQLEGMSMESDVENQQCPFVLLSFNSSEYTGNGSEHSLVHVEKAAHQQREIDESHSSAFTKLYLDTYSNEAYGIFENLYVNNCQTIMDFVDYTIENENPGQTFYDTNETVEYEGETYRIFRDVENSDMYGGLVPMDMTYQDIYPHTLEADTRNITTAWTPFVVCWIGDEGGHATYGPTAKYTTVIAVR